MVNGKIGELKFEFGKQQTKITDEVVDSTP